MVHTWGGSNISMSSTIILDWLNALTINYYRGFILKEAVQFSLKSILIQVPFLGDAFLWFGKMTPTRKLFSLKRHSSLTFDTDWSCSVQKWAFLDCYIFPTQWNMFIFSNACSSVIAFPSEHCSFPAINILNQHQSTFTRPSPYFSLCY